MEELKNRVMLALIDEMIEILEQIKHDQRFYREEQIRRFRLDEQISKLIFMKRDIRRKELNGKRLDRGT